MKSMEQMQNEILAKAKWDGGFPRAIIYFPGIVSLAHNQEEWDKWIKGEEIKMKIFLGVCGVIGIGMIGFAIWETFK